MAWYSGDASNGPGVTGGVTNSASSTDNMSQAMNYAEEIAEKAHDYDMEMAEFNASESKKNREWQEYMSNTSYQRAVKDLISAGLNPVLASKLTGASTPSGSSASGSSSAGTTLSSVFGTLINSAVSANNKMIDAIIASNQMANQKEIANISGAYSLQNTALSGQYKLIDTSLSGSIDKEIAELNNEAKSKLQEVINDHDIYIHDNYPNNAWETFVPIAKEILAKIFGDDSDFDKDTAGEIVGSAFSAWFGHGVNYSSDNDNLNLSMANLSYQYEGKDLDKARQTAKGFALSHPKANSKEINDYVHSYMLKYHGVNWNHDYGNG